MITLAFIPVFVPLVPLIFGGAVGGSVVAIASSNGGKKKAKIAALKARIEALERSK